MTAIQRSSQTLASVRTSALTVVVSLTCLLLQSMSGTRQGTPAPATGIKLVHKSGQTFITWNEAANSDTIYHVYRSWHTITDVHATGVVLIGTVGQDSGEFYADRVQDGSSCTSSTQAPS